MIQAPGWCCQLRGLERVPESDIALARAANLGQLLPQSSDDSQQGRSPLPERLLSILRELDLLDCADALSGGRFSNPADVAAAGADALIALGLKKPHAHRIVNRSRTVASTQYATVPDHAIPGGRAQCFHARTW